MRSSLLDELGEDYLVDGARQRTARHPGPQTPRGPQCAAPHHDSRGHQHRVHRLGCDHHRDHLLHPGPRPPRVRSHLDPRLLGAAGHLPDRLRRRDPGQLPGQPRLRPHRPTGADMSAEVSTTSTAGQLARRRRTPPPAATGGCSGPASPACSGSCCCCSSSRSHSPRRCWPIRTGGRHQGDRRGPGAAVAGVPARHRRQRALGPHPADLGRPGLAVRRPDRNGHRDGHRHRDRARLGVPPRLAGGPALPAHRVVPGDPVPAAGTDPRSDPGPRPAQHRRRHRGPRAGRGRRCSSAPRPCRSGSGPTSNGPACSAPDAGNR